MTNNSEKSAEEVASETVKQFIDEWKKYKLPSGLGAAIEDAIADTIRKEREAGQRVVTDAPTDSQIYTEASERIPIDINQFKENPDEGNKLLLCREYFASGAQWMRLKLRSRLRDTLQNPASPKPDVKLTSDEIEKIKKRLERIESGDGSQTDESLLALANDIGLIVNPSLRIAASVASELLEARKVLRRLIGERVQGIEGNDR